MKPAKQSSRGRGQPEFTGSTRLICREKTGMHTWHPELGASP